MTEPRDTQRKRVYDWETAYIPGWSVSGEKRLSLAQCQNLVTNVWHDYRPTHDAPRVKDGRGCRVAHGGRWSITLPRWSRTVPVVLHETAHSLTPYGKAAHGPEFVRLFIDLLVRYYRPDSKRELQITARASRIRIARASAVPQPVKRRSSRPATERRPCRPHVWLRGALVSEELTRQGYVLIYEAVCHHCRALRKPAVTTQRQAALRR